MSEHERLIASAVAEARVSAIKDMAMRSAAVPDVASLAWGLPSFRTPKHIRRAAARALAEDPDAGKYTLPNGLPELRRLAAAHYQARTGIALDPEANLFVSAGNMQGVNSVLRAILDPGDEVIVTDPGFASHYQQVRLNGGTPVPWSLDEEAGWALNLDALDACLSPRSKALILVSPSNPTGAVFSEADLRALAERLAEHGVLLVIDDPYSDIPSDSEEPFFNPAAQEELREQLVYLFTFSLFTFSAHLFEYVAPQGAYYVFPRILAPHQDSFEFALRVLEEHGVSMTPGSAFGPSGEHHVRMAFCVDEQVINEAFDRLERL